MRDYMCNLVIPAIQDKWPDEDLGRTIFIQQDNAKPHLLPHDAGFRNAVAQTDLDIRLLQQPPNSPDLNVLDLCFFRSLQSLTDTRAPNNIRELIEGVEEEFKNYEVKKLTRSFMSLKSCMIKVMEAEGVIGYDIPHMGKDRLEAEGRLEEVMDDLSISAKVLKKIKDLIVQYKQVEEEEASKQQQAEEAIKRRGKQVEEASKQQQSGSKQATMEEAGEASSSNKHHKKQASSSSRRSKQIE
jgi:hypothetical protein